MSLCLVRIRRFVAEAGGAGEEAGTEADFQVLENSKGRKELRADFFAKYLVRVLLCNTGLQVAQSDKEPLGEVLVVPKDTSLSPYL